MKMNHSLKVRFAGHETFTLKQLWLRKAVRFVQQAVKEGRQANFRDDAAIVELGLGKNMVSSLRFWSVACGFLNSGCELTPTGLALKIFGTNDSDGLDPYIQNLTTSWVVHWNLCSDPSKLTVFWYLFNKINKSSISRSEFLEDLSQFVNVNDFHVTENTLKRDVEVCIRSYAPLITGRAKDSFSEECAETLLGGLGLMEFRSRDVIEVSRTRRYSLPTSIFLWSILDMWEKDEELRDCQTLDWFQLAYAENSPGRIFKLSENDLSDRLEQSNSLTNNTLVWTDQLGIKTLVRRTNDPHELSALKESLLVASYQ